LSTSHVEKFPCRPDTRVLIDDLVHRATAREVAVTIGPDFQHLLGTPRLLFDFLSVGTVPELNRFQYAPSADGLRFLVNAHATDTPPSVDVLLNWPAALRTTPLVRR
jgi:hypothetical protein